MSLGAELFLFQIVENSLCDDFANFGEIHHFDVSLVDEADWEDLLGFDFVESVEDDFVLFGLADH